jgi:hypothetical protein
MSEAEVGDMHAASPALAVTLFLAKKLRESAIDMVF